MVLLHKMSRQPSNSEWGHWDSGQELEGSIWEEEEKEALTSRADPALKWPWEWAPSDIFGLYAPYSPWPFAGPAVADCSLISGLFRSLLVPIDIFPPIRIYISEPCIGRGRVCVSHRGNLTQPDPETAGALPSSPWRTSFPNSSPSPMQKKLLIEIGMLKMRKIILLRNVPWLIKIWHWLSNKHFVSSCIKR